MSFIFFLLGLAVGSFINMAVWRLGHKQSLLRKQRSFCDFCQKKLKWDDNIPLVSFLAYRGKSRCCGQKLPVSYPIVELLTGIVFSWQINPPPAAAGSPLEEGGRLLLLLIIWGVLIFEAVFDFKYQLIPDATAYPLIGLGALWWFGQGREISSLVAAAATGLFLFILHKIRIRGQEAMGDGDIFLGIFMGLFLGYPGVLVALYVAFIAGAAVGVGLIVWGKKNRMTPLPFGPFLVLGTVVAQFWGEKIIGLIF